MLKIFLVDDSGLVRRRLSALISALAGVVIVGESEEADTALNELLRQHVGGWTRILKAPL